MQRHLGALTQQGFLDRIGQTRSTVYALTELGMQALQEQSERVQRMASLAKPAKHKVVYTVDRSLTEGLVVREDAEEFQVGSESLAIRDQIRQPQQKRKPVGYRREFLEAYEPNVTSYLPEKLVSHLYDVGQSEHMAGLPPGTYARQVMDRLLIDLSWNSSRLEGNTYSLLETDHLLKLGKTEDLARLLEAQMILNHKAAIEFIVDAPMTLGYNRYTFFNLHAILTEGLLSNPASEGRLLTIPVGIGGTVYHPENTPVVIDECFDSILQKVDLIEEPLEKAFFLMVHLPYLQPFEDGNKRTSRLIANLPLIQSNLSLLSFIDTPTRDYVDGILTVYELNRVELLRDVFAAAYEKSAGRYASIRHEMGDPDPFWLRYREEIKERVREVVVAGIGKLEAAVHLRKWARTEVTASNRARFIELVEEQLVEEQLLVLNEGNMVRMRLRPSEFEAWLPNWQS
ncbi:MAG: Fic family protein [Verrucomicrobiales bacterium]